MGKGAELFWGASLWLYSNGKVGSRFHKWHSLRYIMKGSALLRMGERELTVRQGESFCIPADTVYQIEPLNGKILGYYDFKFSLDDPFLREKLEKIHPPKEADSSGKEMLDYLMKNWNAQDGENQNICENFLISLLLLLFVKDVSYETEDSPFIITEHYNKTTRKIIRYVEQNYFSAFSLEEMGKELNYNKN